MDGWPGLNRNGQPISANQLRRAINQNRSVQQLVHISRRWPRRDCVGCRPSYRRDVLGGGACIEEFSPALTNPDGPLYPPLKAVREISYRVALAVGPRQCGQD